MKGSLQVKINPSIEKNAIALSELLQGLVKIPFYQDRIITGLTLDSRTATSGDLFCAVRGTHQHGLCFADKAVARGVDVILAEAASMQELKAMVDTSSICVPILIMPNLSQHLSAIAGRFYQQPSTKLDVIGVTGTNGKTSVCRIIAQALNPHPSCAVIGTLGYGYTEKLKPTHCTTPDPIKTQSILADLYEQGTKTVAIEISSHALDQHRTDDVSITTAIFTNLTRDHLDYHHHLSAYAQAKQRLFSMPGLKTAILNADDHLSSIIMAGLNPAVEPILYSLDPGFIPPRRALRWLRLEFIEHLPRGMQMWVTGSWGSGTVKVPMLGRFNAANLLAALAALLLREPNLNKALQRLARVQPVPGRMECFGADDQPLVVVDYAHTPDALEQALKELRTHQPNRIITVFGCGGERDRGKRPQMGAIAERASDLIILTDDNPRSEDGTSIIQDIMAGMKQPDLVQIERQRSHAIRHAINQANSQDIVLIAGKGHETTQRVGDIEYPFSDRTEVIKVLQQ